MAAEVKIVLDPNLEAFWRQAPEVGRILEGMTAAIAVEVFQQAPEQTGAFRQSITERVTLRGRRGWVGEIGSTDIAAHLIEFGSINNPPYAPFRKAVRALGLRIQPSERDL